MASNQSARLSQQRVSLPVGNKDIEGLLLWRDVRKSAVVFAGITVVYIVLEWSHLSLLRIVAHSLLAGVAVSFLWNNVASFTNRPGVPIPNIIRHGVTDSQVRAFSERAIGPINRVLAFVKRLASGQEVLLSVQVAAALYVFGRLGSYFTSLGLVYTLVVLAFTIPKAYEVKKDEVDQVVNSVNKQTRTYYKQYAEPYVQKIPRASTSTGTGGSVTAGGSSQNAPTSSATGGGHNTGRGGGGLTQDTGLSGNTGAGGIGNQAAGNNTGYGGIGNQTAGNNTGYGGSAALGGTQGYGSNPGGPTGYGGSAGVGGLRPSEADVADTYTHITRDEPKKYT